MKITTVGRKMTVTDDLKELFDKKLKKFDKFFKDEAEATVVLSERKNGDKRLELTLSTNGTMFRSEETNTTFQNALDRASDAIERQIRKNKTRLEKRLREGAYKPEYFSNTAPVEEEEKEFNIRVKKFAIKPMSVEEAILQMNLLDHEFFAFRDQETEQVNVVYKRNDGGYGLIVGE